MIWIHRLPSMAANLQLPTPSLTLALKSTLRPTFRQFSSLSIPFLNLTALLYPTPLLSTHMNYREGVGAASFGGFSILRPTIELPLDDILNGVDNPDASKLGLPLAMAAIPNSLNFISPSPSTRPSNSRTAKTPGRRGRRGRRLLRLYITLQ